jgi:hypothetical protein
MFFVLLFVGAKWNRVSFSLFLKGAIAMTLSDSLLAKWANREQYLAFRIIARYNEFRVSMLSG